MVPPPDSDGAAAFLLADVGGQDAVAEHGVVQVQVAFLLLLHEHADCYKGQSAVNDRIWRKVLRSARNCAGSPSQLRLSSDRV